MNKKGLITVHFSVFLLGASGVFVKLIPMPALLITLGRALFSSFFLYIFVHYKHLSLRLNRARDYFWNCLAGILLAVHWFCFIVSIQVSTVYIGTILYATYPMFVMLIEPYVFKEKFQLKNIICLFLICVGVGFLIPAFKLTNSSTLGIIYGLISSLSFAILQLINRRLAFHYDSSTISLYEHGVSTLVLTSVLSLVNWNISQGNMINFIELIIYGVVFTALAHTLYVKGLKDVNAQTASIITVLQPIYSVVLAYIFLHERLSVQENAGALIILAAVLIGTSGKEEENE